MTLRTRLLLGYGYLAALIVVTAALSFVALQRFRQGLDRVLRENVPSVQSAVKMIDALDRQNGATFALLLGDDAAAEALRAADAAFDDAVAEAAAHAYTPTEAAIIAALREEVVPLRGARDRLVTSRTGTPLAAYDEEVGGRFDSLKRQARTLLSENLALIQRTEQEVRQDAFGFALGLAGLVVVALLSLGFMSRALQATVLSRLSELKELGDAIAAGDRARRFRARRDDELGLLARHLNVALDKQEQLQAHMEGRFNHQAQLLLGLLANRGPSAVVALDGDVIASSLSAADAARVGALSARIRAARDGVDPAQGKVVRDLDGFTLELLVANGARPVGWLVTPAAASSAG